MIDWVRQVHNDTLRTQDSTTGSTNGQSLSTFGCTLPQQVVKLCEALGLRLSKLDVEELASAFIVISALRMGGRRFPTSEGQYVTPAALIEEFDCFGEPVLLRDTQSKDMN
jgi:hypothetical protein